MNLEFAALRKHLRLRGAAFLVLAISLFCTVFLSLRFQHHVTTREQRRFEETGQAVFKALELHLDYHIDFLKAVRGLLFTRTTLTQEEWKEFFKSYYLQESHPGILDVGYAVRVPAHEKDQHATAMSKEGNPGYRIWPEGERSVFFPVIRVQKVADGPSTPVGWDAFSEERRQSAMEHAMDSGEPCSTGKISLHPFDTNRMGFVVYVPVYRGGVTPPTVEARRGGLEGFVFGSYAPVKLWAGAVGQTGKPLLDLEIYDGEMKPENQLFDYDGVLHSLIQRKHSGEIQADALGRRWTIHLSTGPAFEIDSLDHLPFAIFISGLTISLLLFGIVHTQVQARLAVEKSRLDLHQSREILLKTNVQLEAAVREGERTQEALVKNQTRLRLLNNILASEGSGNCVQEVLARTVNRIRDVFPHLRARYSVIDETGQLTVLYSSEPLGWPSLQGQTADLSAAPDYLATLRRREPVIVHDVNLDPRLKPLLETMTAYGNRSVLDVPLKHSEKELGLLCLDSIHPHDWSDHEVETLKEIVEYLAIAFKQTAAEEDRKRAEEALAAEKEWLSVTLRSIADGVITTDIHGRIILLNKVAELLTGWPQRTAVGRPLNEVFRIVDETTRQPVASPVEKVLIGGEIFGLASRTLLIARDGAERVISNSGAPILDSQGKVLGVVLVFRDIREKEKLEREMLKASKLESLSLLAGGIAHDFNNILTGILGNVSLAKMFTASEEKVQERLEQAETACLRARDLTQQLLTFAKGGAPIKKTVPLIGLIQDSIGFALHGSSVRCEMALSTDLWPAAVDEGQIRQVMYNLIINATEAMPEGGIIELKAENLTLDLQSPLPATPGPYVRITLQDHGAGIRPEHLPRIFDPYFTTKYHGSGLGLATAYSIIKNHGGIILAESELGVGTRFQIYLPASPGQISERSEAARFLGPHGGRILVMDDEPLILELAKAMLKHLGYEVELAKTGTEAIQRYAEARDQGKGFHAVMMDLTIPGGMGGKEAIKKLRALDPKAKAIVSSGYSNDPVMANYEEYGFDGVVTKPYHADELAKVLQQVLGDGAADQSIGGSLV